MAIYLSVDSLTIRTCPGSSTDLGGVKLSVSLKKRVHTTCDDGGSESEGDFDLTETASLRVSYSILSIF